MVPLVPLGLAACGFALHLRRWLASLSEGGVSLWLLLLTQVVQHQQQLWRENLRTQFTSTPPQAHLGHVNILRAELGAYVGQMGVPGGLQLQ